MAERYFSIITKSLVQLWGMFMMGNGVDDDCTAVYVVASIQDALVGNCNEVNKSAPIFIRLIVLRHSHWTSFLSRFN